MVRQDLLDGRAHAEPGAQDRHDEILGLDAHRRSGPVDTGVSTVVTVTGVSRNAS